MKKGLKRICNAVIVLLAGIIAGFLLMVGAYSIPVDRMVKHSESAAEILYDMQKMDITANLNQWCGFGIDTFTDAIMISTSICDSGEKLLQRAMKNQRIEYDEIDAYTNLLKYYGIDAENGKKIDPDTEYRSYSYARYWNGYVVILKPLLYLFDYKVVLIFNCIFQAGLALVDISLLIKRKKGFYIIPFLVFLGTVSLVATSFCLQFSNVMYITLISILVLLLFHEKINDSGKFIYLFLVNGMLLGYFDILTYPLVALGIPLVLYISIYENNIKSVLKRIICFSTAWTFGYGGMWCSKWGLATLLTEQNVIKNAFDSVSYRMNAKINMNNNGISSDESIKNNDINQGWISEFAYKDVIIRNLYGMFNIVIISVMIVLLTIFVWRIIDAGFKMTRNIAYISVPFLIISLYPFVWYRFVENHSYSHYFFTYRILSISLLAVLCMLIKIIEHIKKE